MNTLKHPPFPRAAVLAGMAVIALIVALSWLTEMDRSVANAYLNAAPSWPGRHWGWSMALYRWGQWPAFATGLGGLAAFALSFGDRRRRHWRGPGLFLFLLLALGPGLLVNGLSKALAGRPRPEETLDFGGLWAFRRPFQLGVPGQGRSFISGHVSNAFYFFGLLWLLRPSLKWAAGALVLAFGGAMTVARASQGAHWLSDGLLAGALLFTLAAALSPLIHWQPKRGFWKRPGLAWALGLGALAYLSISQVTYEDRRFVSLWQRGFGRPHFVAPQQRLVTYQGAQAPSEVAVDLELTASDLDVRFDLGFEGLSLPLNLSARFQGMGLPGAKESLNARYLSNGPGPFKLGPTTLGIGFAQTLKGLWLTARGEADLGLPRNLAVDARLRVPAGRLTIGPLPSGRRVLISHLPREAVPPASFQAYGNSSWLREGDEPLIALDLQAAQIRFEEP